VRRDPFVKINFEHSLKNFFHYGWYFNFRVVLFLENRVKSWNNLSLFGNNFREKTSLDREESFFLQVRLPDLVGYKQRKTHPKRNSYNDFQKNTSKRPHINRPWILVVVHYFLIKFFLIFSLILTDNIIENLWRHVLRSSHRELRDISKLKGRPVVDKLELCDLEVLLLVEFYQDVLSL